MLRLDQLYFRNFSILFFATLIVTAVSGYFLLERIEIDNHKAMLSKMIDTFVAAEKHLDDPTPLISEVHRQTGVRITIIDKRGKVLFESNRDPKGMENHRLRPEIVEASRKGIGYAIRHSVSVGIDFLYVAKKQKNGFVRMAYALHDIKANFIEFWLKAMVLFTFALLLSFWIAMKINRRISADLEHIEKSLQNLLNKKYEVVFGDVKCCKEFDTIARQIKKVAKKLQKRARQKAKYTKNLKILSQKQSDIISAISHEFKNPVAAIIGYAQTVREDPDISPQIRDKFLAKVVSNAGKISGMIDRLALAIKLENENFKPELTQFPLAPLVEEVRETLLQKYKDRVIEVEIDDLKIRADKAMFENLMTNLIENALKYSEEEVIVRANRTFVEVIDKGIGISEADIRNITKRFFRVDALSWDNSIGVGLYIVKYILKLHNTQLQIESEPNRGSRFWFSIEKLIVKPGD